MNRKRRMKRKDGDDKREGEMIDEMRGREKAEEGDGKGASMEEETGGSKREGDWESQERKRQSEGLRNVFEVMK